MARIMGANIYLSARDLAGVLEGCCPRCFWISYYCELPYQMPFPGVFNVIDACTKRVVHSHFDRHGRLPDWYPKIGQVVGYVSSGRLHHSRFRTYDAETGVRLWGSPDDVFRLSDGSYHIVDYKTAKLTPVQDDLFREYEVQLNCYAYIATRVGLSPVSGLSLIFMEPKDIVPAHAGAHTALGFVAKHRAVSLRPRRLIPPLLRRARRILSRSRPPRGAAGCEDCTRLEELVDTIH
jgi:hypothetical protein